MPLLEVLLELLLCVLWLVLSLDEVEGAEEVFGALVEAAGALLVVSPLGSCPDPCGAVLWPKLFCGVVGVGELCTPPDWTPGAEPVPSC